MAKKIDEAKLAEATKKLATILAMAGEFNEGYKRLNSQERALIGSIVIGVESVYDGLEMSGFVGSDAQINGLINEVAARFNQYLGKKMQARQQESQLAKATMKPDDKTIN